MAILDIPVDGSIPYWDQTMQLEGREYLMVFAWADREACWYLHLYDQDENQLATGIKLVMNASLLRRWKSDSRIPPGVLLVTRSGTGGDMTVQTDLGDSHSLTYFTSDDPLLAG